MSGPEKLMKWRQDRGWTRAELARFLGYTERSAVRLYECGIQRMPYPRLINAARATGISIWDLATPQQRREMVLIHEAVTEQRTTRAMKRNGTR